MRTSSPALGRRHTIFDDSQLTGRYNESDLPIYEDAYRKLKDTEQSAERMVIIYARGEDNFEF